MIEREGVRPVALWCRRHGALLAMVGVLMVTAWVASRVHHPGHAWGDDFSLYLRQAKGIVEGNASQVVGDNHFTVTTSGRPLFSPLIYPWGFPMMLSVFYKAFGMNYLQLKMGMVIIFCGYLWFFHLVLRRRMNQWVALATATAMATSLAYLRHTDYLLSELPYMFAAAVALWWLDHCRRKSRLHEATRHELIVLGVLAMYVFNTRREGLAFIIAVGAVQLWDLRGQSRTANWWRVGTPFMSFVGSLVLLQLLLPSSLAPDTEKAGLGQTWKKLTGPWHRDFASQLGIPSLHGFWLFVVFAIAIAGLLWRLVTATRDDLGIAVFAVLSMTIVGMIDANSIRYLMSITPWALYFGVQALSALRVPRKERTRQFGPIIAAAAMVLLVVHHSTQLPLAIKATDSTNATMPTADGPESAYVQPAWTAVRKYTHTQDVVAFWRARALTLYTDRRGIQTSDLALVNQQADFFLMRRNFSFFQPLVSDAEAAAMGWKNVWQDSKWVLWQVRQPFG